jgi:hypothetical protein
MQKSERVVIACPTCTQRIRAPRAIIGQAVTCPTCRTLYTAELPEAIGPSASPQLVSVAPPPLAEVARVPTETAVQSPADRSTTTDQPALTKLGRRAIQSCGMPWILGSSWTPVLLLAIQVVVYVTMFFGGILATMVGVELVGRNILSSRTGFFFVIYAWWSTLVGAVIFRLVMERIVGRLPAKEQGQPVEHSSHHDSAADERNRAPGN